MKSREYIEKEVEERSRHDTAEDVRTTCSFARAERLLGREYHGRFLIELLQNAADAWREDPRSRRDRSRVEVLLTDDPALIVANQGVPITAQVVIEALGHIGASTKHEGEAIGHKGIGFKSVLEVTSRPEIYSGLQDGEQGVAVAFDAGAALESIRRLSPQWTQVHVEVAEDTEPITSIPVLRFPQWIETPPPETVRLAEQGYDTVIRLPFDRQDPSSERGELDWTGTVRRAIEGVTDEILLLLAVFDEVTVDDRIAETTTHICPQWSAAPLRAEEAGETVVVRRNDVVSSSWRLWKRSVHAGGGQELASELAVGVCLDDGDEGKQRVVAAGNGAASAPFHLFFPTRIGSGMPFLLHGYFEVDASRTGFYRGSDEDNRALLDELAYLTAQAVVDLGADERIDLVSLVDLVAEAGTPEEPLAAHYRARVLDLLDDRPWIPAGPGGARRARPYELLVDDADLVRRVADVFPPDYVSHRVGLELPSPQLTDESFTLLARRQPEESRSIWELLGDLCRPGPRDIWSDEQIAAGFHSLLGLIDALRVRDEAAATQLIDDLRGDEAARLLPAVSGGGGLTLLPVPDPSAGTAGNRSLLVMARVAFTGRQPLAPPDDLDLAFLPDGLLASEGDIDRAKPLGVRPFTVDNVLDRLGGTTNSDVDHEALLRFLWRLLSTERQNPFGTAQGAKRAAALDPSDWFWCRPGRAMEDDVSRLRQQRERFLAEVCVPCRDGRWRRATETAFGADWAEWVRNLASSRGLTEAVERRAAAYEALERVTPEPGALLATPAVLAGLLEDPGQALPADVAEPGDDGESTVEEERHAFLLRLGVWEVLPVEAFESRERAGRTAFPWTGEVARMQRAAVDALGGWTFGLNGWGGRRHHNVHLVEDFRFRWALGEAAERDADAVALLLTEGEHLYAERMHSTVTCFSCKDDDGAHRTARSSSPAAGYPSWLALQLRSEGWVRASVDGRPVGALVAPNEVWWLAKPPSGSGLRQSAWRYLPISGPESGLTERLRHLCQPNVLDTADLDTIRALLTGVRGDFEAGALPVDPLSSGSARRAFISLHRLFYERLAEVLAGDTDEAVLVLDEVGVLCERGEGLVYRHPAEARHDDGRFSAYVRHFAGQVPLAVLPREDDALAARLGIRALHVALKRVGNDGIDVTDDVHALVGDRVAELLAIVVNHSLGTQTVELASQQFDERARRLTNLAVRQVEDLIVEATVDGLTVTLGQGSNQDVYLENPTSTHPVLFHDLHGDDWPDRLRRKLAPSLAAILENASYAHTFALFLQAETDADREEFLLDLGISADEVDAVSSRIGVVGEASRHLHRRWFAALLACRGASTTDLTLEHEQLVTRLRGAGFDEATTALLVERGGGEDVRRATEPGSPLWMLKAAGLSVAELDMHLRAAGDAGIDCDTGRRELRRWMDAHGRRIAALLEPVRGSEVAKTTVRELKPSPDLHLELAPAPEQILLPVVQLLAQASLDADPAALYAEPAHELVRLSDAPDLRTLDEQVRVLYSDEERRRILRERAGEWRRAICRLAVLVRIGPSETRHRVREIDDDVQKQLPSGPSSPRALVEAVDELFVKHRQLREHIQTSLTDSLAAPGPQEGELLDVAEASGVAIERMEVLRRALDAPRRQQARQIMEKAAQLREDGLAPATPPSLRRPRPVKRSDGGRKTVRKIKIGASQDRRKRELGDQGEQWALAAIVDDLVGLDQERRDQALDGVTALLSRFDGEPVTACLEHLEIARGAHLDQEELVDELSGALHVARHSDAFGFDLIGWLGPTDQERRAVCLEVKSSGGRRFHLSSSEWDRARTLHDDGDGDLYAVLIVRRGRRGSRLPVGMDLLVDPVAMADEGLLRSDIDGYRMAYESD